MSENISHIVLSTGSGKLVRKRSDQEVQPSGRAEYNLFVVGNLYTEASRHLLCRLAGSICLWVIKMTTEATLTLILENELLHKQPEFSLFLFSIHADLILYFSGL